jgi:hypothetical protein
MVTMKMPGCDGSRRSQDRMTGGPTAMGRTDMLRSVRQEFLGVGALLLLALPLQVGTASAGTVDIHCDCAASGYLNYIETCDSPNSSNTYYNIYWCQCSESQGLDAFATNQYNRYCDQSAAVGDNVYSVFAPKYCIPAPVTLVEDIPTGVTCTDANTIDGSSTNGYVYQECTNWNTSKRHVTVEAFCANWDTVESGSKQGSSKK